MIDWNEARLTTLSVHQVGNRFNNQGFVAAKEPVNLNDETLLSLLEQWFIRSFKRYDAYCFGASQSAQIIFPIVKEYFAYPTSQFMECSAKLTESLYEASVHPKINSGDVFIAHFENVMYDDELTSALAIFKAETKEQFLNVLHGNQEPLEINEGWHLGKMDKAAVILNTMEEDGYRIYTSDLSGRDAQYWKERFLGIEPVADNKYFTREYMKVCKEAIHDLTTLDNAGRLQEAQWLNRAGEYFDMHSEFKEDDFAERVFSRPEHAHQFFEKKQARQMANAADYTPEFLIHKEAVREMRPKFKNKILLDNNFELRILPNPEEPDLGEQYIRKGYDEDKQMHYYQVFFRKEL